MTDNKVDYFDGIRDHFSALDTKVIEVPEWGLVGDKAIHCKPFNMLEKQKIFKGASNTDLLVLIDVIIEKALTKDGKKMFTGQDVLGFKTKADTNIIADVATKIMGPSLQNYPQNPTRICGCLPHSYRTSCKLISWAHHDSAPSNTPNPRSGLSF